MTRGQPPARGGSRRRPPSPSGRSPAPAARGARPPAPARRASAAAGTSGRAPARRAPGAAPSGGRSSDRGLGGEQVEGRQAVRELLLAGARKVRELWVANDLDDRGTIADILDIAADHQVPIREVARRRLEAEARTDAPQGMLAKAAPLPEADLDDLMRRRRGFPNPFLVAVDGVTDPGNLGAVLRSAEGAGVTGVVLPRHRSVHVTPTVAKAAAGAIEYLPMTVVSGLPAALARMKDAGVWVVGLDDAAGRSLFDLDDLGSEPIVIVLGAEGTGLSRLVRERCDVVLSIPMNGRLSSLNVSAAAALACYEVARRR